MSVPTKTNPIEYFLWSEGKSFHDKLVYYDEQGGCHEADLGAGAIDQALQVFKGRRQAIQRSGGGLSLAEPYQLILVTPQSGPPQLHLKVKFRDLRLGPGNEVIENECVTHTKILPPSDLREPFTFSFWEKQEQRFLLDFGRGAIPVHVFHYLSSPGTAPRACFIQADDLLSLMTASPGSLLAVQTYTVERDVLRWAPDDPRTGRPRQLELARERCEGLRRTGTTVIPTCMENGGRVLVPGGITAHDVRHYLRKSILETKHITAARSLTSTLTSNPSKSLVSFGVFEK